jgi:hypothetical protein
VLILLFRTKVPYRPCNIARREVLSLHNSDELLFAGAERMLRLQNKADLLVFELRVVMHKLTSEYKSKVRIELLLKVREQGASIAPRAMLHHRKYDTIGLGVVCDKIDRLRILDHMRAAKAGSNCFSA